MSDSNESSKPPQDFNIGHHLVESHFSDKPLNDGLKQLLDENECRSGNTTTNGRKYLLQCRVCRCDKSIFFCSDCVRNGDFTDSKIRIPERFAEKKLKYFRLKCEQQLISDRMDHHMNELVIKDELEYKIRLLEANVDHLRSNLSKARQKLSSSESHLRKTRCNQEECKERHHKLEAKVMDAKQFLSRRQNGITRLVESKDSYDSYIKELVQQRVKQLTTYIFPIETKDMIPDTSDRHSILNSETTPLLETISPLNTPINYSIVEPWICGNGDYSAYALFATNERDYLNRDSSFRNAKYRTCAALAYITQLVNIIAFYLDIRLPKRLLYSEFFISDLNETQFTHKVAKLNANIVYLCLSQNIDSELLNPRQTVQNLLHLLNSSHGLGIRNGPIVMTPDFYDTIESCLLEDLYLIDESELDDNANDQNDENLIIEYDWVENNLPDLQLNIDAQYSKWCDIDLLIDVEMG
ncbi:unnamed protein product [Oppiella nova]|uniref:Beclin 1-associated autophagy-related key regulator n=1 Tax=Oppiella nova TaxID=334625 RepID=A0A7R9M8Y1_9ACAR|nr:unnamed protein product [Oppiella nova]CAG2172929.1 unnamed protein product [Oppiella nova]